MSDYVPPAMRALNAQPVKVEGRTLILVQDPLGLCPKPAMLPLKAYLIMTQLDGVKTVRDIQVACQRHLGELVFSEEIEMVIEQLDEHFLLNSSRFQDALAGARADFEAAETRPASHAGLSYPLEAEELKKTLDGILALAPAGPLAGMRALIAPHIDFSRGAAVYAAAYQALSSRRDRLHVLLGTAHVPTAERFVVCDKDFATPLGRAHTDAEAAGRLRNAAQGRYQKDILVHLKEHSLEFQVIFLQHLIDPEVRILPILCGGLAEAAQGGPSPVDDQGAVEFLGLLGQITRQEEALVVVGADLAHLGPQFGHKELVSKPDLVTIRRDDMTLLDQALARDAEGFFGRVAAERDQRNICGLAPIYAALKILPPSRGRLLGYDIWRDEQGRGAVSFASLGFVSP